MRSIICWDRKRRKGHLRYGMGVIRNSPAASRSAREAALRCTTTCCQSAFRAVGYCISNRIQFMLMERVCGCDGWQARSDR